MSGVNQCRPVALGGLLNEHRAAGAVTGAVRVCATHSGEKATMLQYLSLAINPATFFCRFVSVVSAVLPGTTTVYECLQQP